MEDIRILLVDDEAPFRAAIARRLRKRKATVSEAADGEQCLALLREHPVDIVVSDVRMPGIDGIELLGRIKALYPETEVILLTGHATTPDGVEGIKSGAFDYLTKPVELEHLISKIRQAREAIVRREEQRREAEFKEKMARQMVVTERLAALGTLATGVAHEINNPLAIIRESAGWMELILGKEELADMPRKADFEKALAKIEKGVERAKRITHQLLGFVQKNDSAYAEADLSELIDECVQLLGREAANKGINLIREVDDKVSPFLSDPYQLRQVLLNLVTNAIHATDRGGRITLGLTCDDKTVRLRVADTGQGIPQENMKKIFEPFFTTKSPGKGTGLGLFVTRGIVERLGGTMEAESRLGEGTTFTIILPRQQEFRKNIDASQADRLNLLNKITKAIS